MVQGMAVPQAVPDCAYGFPYAFTVFQVCQGETILHYWHAPEKDTQRLSIAIQTALCQAERRQRRRLVYYSTVGPSGPNSGETDALVGTNPSIWVRIGGNRTVASSDRSYRTPLSRWERVDGEGLRRQRTCKWIVHSSTAVTVNARPPPRTTGRLPRD